MFPYIFFSLNQQPKLCTAADDLLPLEQCAAIPEFGAQLIQFLLRCPTVLQPDLRSLTGWQHMSDSVEPSHTALPPSTPPAFHAPAVQVSLTPSRAVWVSHAWSAGIWEVHIWSTAPGIQGNIFPLWAQKLTSHKQP